MKLKILVTAGDGIGPEVTSEAVSVLQIVAKAGGHEIAVTENGSNGNCYERVAVHITSSSIAASMAKEAVSSALARLLLSCRGGEFPGIAAGGTGSPSPRIAVGASG